MDFLIMIIAAVIVFGKLAAKSEGEGNKKRTQNVGPTAEEWAERLRQSAAGGEVSDKLNSAVETAQNAAKALDVTLHVIEAADTAADELLKFQLLMQTADKLDCRFISTGHYARVEQDADECRLCAPEHAECDQTALLEVLPQEILARLILPLGEFDKESVQEIAQDIGCAE